MMIGLRALLESSNLCKATGNNSDQPPCLKARLQVFLCKPIETLSASTNKLHTACEGLGAWDAALVQSRNSRRTSP